MKYTAKNGTIVTIPDKLSPAQKKELKALADSGYGKKAQRLADKYKAELKGGQSPERSPIAGTVNPEAGQVKPGPAQKAIEEIEKEDVDTNFKIEQPREITDGFGNKRIVTRHADGSVTVEDKLGGTAQKFKDLAEAAASTFQGDVSRARAEEATYSTLTRDFDRNRSRDMEEAKQELANRGIQYDPAAAQDPNSKDAYGRVVGGIDQRYQDMNTQARQQAILAGNQAYATDAAARDSFLSAVTSGASTFSGNFQPYSSGIRTDNSQDAKDLIELSAAQFLAKYGIDKDAYSKKYAVDKAAAAAAPARTGGGSPGFEIQG